MIGAVSRWACTGALVTVLMLACWGASPAGAEVQDPSAHDPTLAHQGESFYLLDSTYAPEGTLLGVRRSRDLAVWEAAGTVFVRPPVWLVRELGMLPAHLWAPDLSFFGGRWHVYYALSTFGTNDSTIGLATNATLDAADPAYRWIDEGMVLRSRPGIDDFNAIDPDVVLDEAGTPWLAFGSFWSGIRLVRLDPGTGRPSTADADLHALASRPGITAIEAPSIVHRGGYFYLFVSFDFCCRGVNSTYRIMVGRSHAVTGPYVDRAGVPMTAGGGTELVRGAGRYAGPGGSDVYREGDRALLVHHYYDRELAGAAKLSIRELRWLGGWPEASEPLQGGRPVGFAGPPWTAPWTDRFDRCGGAPC
jgi:arabinan endo-1,5-alpha-L-arabinosidase